MPDLSRRSEEIEIMDNLLCSGEVVHQTLRELEFINRWLGGNAITLDGVRKLVTGHEQENITIADLGCGSGDMLRILAVWGRKRNIKMKLVGIDANPNIIAYARQHNSGFPEISFEAVDILSSGFMDQKYDVVIGTLFYHHFPSDTLTKFFARLKDNTRLGLVINDLHRNWIAYQSIRILTHLFSKSSMVKFDAPLSVRRGFKKRELQEIMINAGIKNFSLRWKWAFRWQVTAC